MRTFERVIITSQTVDAKTGTVIAPERVVEDRVRAVYSKRDGSLEVNWLKGRKSAVRGDDGIVRVRQVSRRVNGTSHAEVLAMISSPIGMGRAMTLVELLGSIAVIAVVVSFFSLRMAQIDPVPDGSEGVWLPPQAPISVHSGEIYAVKSP